MAASLGCGCPDFFNLRRLIVLPPEQLSEMWCLHAQRLLLVARAIGEPAEDAVQEAFLRLSQLDQAPDQPMAWLVRVVRNQLIQWHRAGQRRLKRDQDVSTERSWFADPDPTDRLVTQEVTQALKSLPDTERQIVVLHLWGQLTFQQIAQELGLSRATAHRRFQETLDLLRRQLEGQTRSDHAPAGPGRIDQPTGLNARPTGAADAQIHPR